MTNVERLKKLFLTCGLKDDDLNNAEIMAYCVGIDLVKSTLDRIKNRVPVAKRFIPPDMSCINENLSGIEYILVSNNMIITDYQLDTVGKKCKDWIGFNINVFFNSSGKTWQEFDSENVSWHTRDSRYLRWSMIRSL